MIVCLLICSCEKEQRESEPPGIPEFSCDLVPDELPAETARLIHTFCRFDGHTTDTLVAACLDAFRQESQYRGVLGQVLSSRLRENDPLYQGRGPQEVIRLRSYLLSTLGSLEVPASAIPYLVAEFTQNQHKSPILVASAARACRGVSEHRDLLTDSFRKYLSGEQMDDIMDLDHYNVWPPISPTSIKEEVLHTVIQFGPYAAGAMPELEAALENSRVEGAVYNRRKELQLLVTNAHHAVQQIGNVSVCKTYDTRALFVSPWRKASTRVSPAVFAFETIDHQGEEGRMEQYKGKPIIATFFYTRCGNLNKCSMTVSKLVQLERELLASGIEDFHILAFSLDPAYDTPKQMKTFAEDRGVDEGSHITLLKLSKLQDNGRFLREMNAAVSYQVSSMVSFHGVELLLLDKRGGFVRRYLDFVQDRQMVVEDMKRLLLEG